MKYQRFQRDSMQIFHILNFAFRRQMSQIIKKGGLSSKIVQKLDKEKFNRKISCPCLIVKNSKNTSDILPKLKKFLFKALKFKAVVEEDNHSVIYLDQNLLDKEKYDLNKFVTDNADKADLDLTSKYINLTYENFTADDLFREILPDGESLSSYSQIGHIIHLNLRDHLIDYKYLIGEILLEKVQTCRTVINKNENIENEFRNLSFELLAGDDNYVTRTKENGILFELDFSKVFWNSRLSMEREKLMKKFNRRDLIYDVFAGVGPFSLMAAVKKNCTVIANDLNPDCVEWLEKNIRLNKTRNVERVYNMDAGRFLDDVVPKDIREKIKSERITRGVHKIHFVMNLPAIAVDFLSHFVGILNDNSLSADDLRANLIPEVFVHCYMFCKCGDADADDVLEGEKKIEKIFGDRKIHDLSVEFVRSVSPMKNMMRASFKLEADVLLNEKRKESDL